MCNIFTQLFVYLEGFTRNSRIIRGNFAHPIKLFLKGTSGFLYGGVTVWSFSATQADMLVWRRATRGSILSPWVSSWQKFTLHRSKSARQHRRKLTRPGHSFLALLSPLLKEGFAFSFTVLEVVARPNPTLSWHLELALLAFMNRCFGVHQIRLTRTGGLIYIVEDREYPY